MHTDPAGAAAARLHLGLSRGEVRAADVTALACELFDLGHPGAAVREAMECVPARLPAPDLAGLARRLLAETGFDPDFDLAPGISAVSGGRRRAGGGGRGRAAPGGRDGADVAGVAGVCD
ncbi:hypothetical protein [Actinacidiphila sp. bgisy145]|uniref:hypothetical protein n=1 Tax=Actinacidiphila sp. bgisy145 TaxID=3413792 RepID=UPI003EBC7F29